MRGRSAEAAAVGRHTEELGPSPGASLVARAVSAVLYALVYVVWSGRIELNAPREQQRDAEEHA
jgi:hypothetical protein